MTDAIAEGVYKCELCQSLHCSQESVCNHYVTDHKVLILFTKTEVLTEDLVEMSEEPTADLQHDATGEGASKTCKNWYHWYQW